MNGLVVPARLPPVIGTDTCGNCKHRVSGVCVVNPPTVFLMTDPQGKPMPISAYPPVKDSAPRCRHYQRKLEVAT